MVPSLCSICDSVSSRVGSISYQRSEKNKTFQPESQYHCLECKRQALILSPLLTLKYPRSTMVVVDIIVRLVCLMQGLTLRLWLEWNSLHRSGFHGTRRKKPASLCLQVLGLKVFLHVQLRWNILKFKSSLLIEVEYTVGTRIFS